MNIFIAFLLALIFIQGVMFLVWLLGIRIRNAGIVDVFWSWAVALPALGYSFFLKAGTFSWIASGAALIWSIRLSGYPTARILSHPDEEPRYRALRVKWGASADQKMLRFYFQQGIGALIFTGPFLIVASDPDASWNGYRFFGVLLALISVFGEALADYQLAQFKKDPAHKGIPCRAGLWNCSRHPNYFFEWLFWVGIALAALPSPGGWISLICPAAMYYILNRVTGIPLTEKQALQSRGDAYSHYQNKVSPFFPWFPKTEKKV